MTVTLTIPEFATVPVECWWWTALVVYLLLSYTILWRMFVRWAELPRPTNTTDTNTACIMWLLSPLFALFCVFWSVLSRLPLWLAYGRDKK